MSSPTGSTANLARAREGRPPGLAALGITPTTQGGIEALLGASGSAAPGAVTPMTAFKLCKKVAQLTKVVYYLNTKVEDHGATVESLTGLYEKELDAVIVDATGRIAALDVQVAQHAAAAAESAASLSAALGRASSAEALVAKLNENLASANAAIADGDTLRITEQARHEAEETDARARAQEARDAHAAELERLRAETQAQTEQHNAQIAAMNETLERRRAAYERDIAALRDELSTATRGHLDKTKRLADQMDEERARLAEKYQTQLTLAQSEAAAARVQLETTQEQLAAFRQKLETQTPYLATLEEQVSALTASNTALEAARAASFAMRDSIQAERDAALARVNQLESTGAELREAQNSLARTNESTAATLSSLQTVHAATAEQFAASEQQRKRALAELDAQTARATALDAECAQATSKLEKAAELEFELRRELSRTKREHQKELQTSKTQLQEQARSSQEHAEKLEQESTKLAQSNAELASELAESRVQHQVALDEQRDAAEARVRELEAELQQARTQIGVKGTAADHLEREATQLQLQLNNAREESSQRAQALQSANEQLAAAQSARQQTLLETAQLEKRLKFEYQEAGIKLREEIERSCEAKTLRDTQQALQQLESTLSMKFEREQFAMCQQHDTALRDVEKRHRDELAKSQKGLEESREQLREARSSARELQERLAAARAAHETDVRTSTERAAADLATRLASLRDELVGDAAQQRAALEEKYQTQLADALQAQTRVVDEVKRAHLLATLALKKDAETQRNAELSQAAQKHQRELQEQQDAAAQRLEHELQQLRLQHVQQSEQARSQAQEQQAAAQEEAAELQRRVTELCTLEKNMGQLVDDLEAKLALARDELDASERTAADLRSELHAKLCDQERALRAALQEDVARLVQKHHNDTQTMLAEFDEARGYFKRTVAGLEQKLRDADVRYEHREPRPEDLQRIADLENEVKRRKQRAKALIEEADHYRLELTNRDANFNKIFTKQPLVGVLDPTDYSPTGSMAALSTRKISGGAGRPAYLQSLLHGESRSETSLTSRLPPISTSRRP